MTELALTPPIRVARLDARKPLAVDLQPDAETRARIAEVLGLEALRKFRFQGELRSLGKRDWELQAHMGATVVQPCAITLAPVVTRIDEPVSRRYLTEMPEPEGLEIEMPEDDSAEPLGATIDISATALEALALALPAFPRAPGAELPQAALTQAPPGATRIEEERPKPFAALAALKNKLDRDGGPDQ
ncbi:MAG: DUF177 domain-containing protein [Rhodobacteraceae bacterium]|nr:MAG: DUF177 domain-containing protein [Paracoccaceae bacterium]